MNEIVEQILCYRDALSASMIDDSRWAMRITPAECSELRQTNSYRLYGQTTLEGDSFAGVKLVIETPEIVLNAVKG